MFVIAHRGDSVNAPENTIAAAKSAMECGADGIEFDVHVSADGKIVVCHDDSIDRTSTGNGMIEELSHEQMLEYDFGSWFGENFKGEKIPLATEYLQAVRGMKIINMEVKAFRTADNQKAYSALYEIIDSFNFYDQFILSSFDQDALKIMRGLDSRIKTAFLGDARYSGLEFIEIARRLGCSAVHPHFRLVDENFMKEAKSSGFDVNAWTVDDKTEILRCADLGCNAVITNNPSLAFETIKR